jgi:DNA-binding NtrC family response regulator
MLIARTFLERFAREEGKQFTGFTPECEQLLVRHRWPGNVRELENVLRNIVVLQDGPTVTPQMLPVELLAGSAVTNVETVFTSPAIVGSAQGEHVARPPAPPSAAASALAAGGLPAIRPLWEVERDAIEAAIDCCEGNVPRAAVALGISPSTIYRKRQAWSAAAPGVDGERMSA